MNKAKKEHLVKSSNRLAYLSGLLGGSAGFRPRSKLAVGLRLSGSVSSIGATVQNFRASEGVGEFIGREFGNIGRSFVGGVAGFTGGTLALRGLKSKFVRGAAKNAGSAARAATDSVRMAAATAVARAQKGKYAKNVNVVFRRIGGRVIPLRKG